MSLLSEEELRIIIPRFGKTLARCQNHEDLSDCVDEVNERMGEVASGGLTTPLTTERLWRWYHVELCASGRIMFEPWIHSTPSRVLETYTLRTT